MGVQFVGVSEDEYQATAEKLVKHHGLTVAAIPGQRLVEDCPIYSPAAREGDDARSRRTAVPS
mgnify:CR=1 FL=1